MNKKINRVWAMPSKDTFSIKPIKNLIETHLDDGVWIDPFARNGIFKNRCKFTNDLNPEFNCTHNLDAYEFLRTFDDESIDGVLFDPPYSFHQIVEVYSGYGGKRLKKISPCFNEISRILKPNGKVIHFGWNSNGCGKKRGFDIEEVLIIAHGGGHNDTIVTVEKKVLSQYKIAV